MTKANQSAELTPAYRLEDVAADSLVMGRIDSGWFEVLEVPADFDYDAAWERWNLAGGQIRNFSCETVDMRIVNFAVWVVRQEGGRMPLLDS